MKEYGPSLAWTDVSGTSHEELNTFVRVPPRMIPPEKRKISVKVTDKSRIHFT
jgi:hypothetical protein